MTAAVDQKHVRSSRGVVAVFQSEVSRGGKRFQDKTKTVPKTLLRFTKPASVSSVNRKVIWIVCRCAKSVVICWPASAAVSSTDFSKEGVSLAVPSQQNGEKVAGSDAFRPVVDGM